MMSDYLMRLWYGDAPGGAALRPLTALYSAITATRTAAYHSGWLRTHRMEKPVIVVGNLTVGGTGKTPLVVWLTQRLTERGLKVAIVSRGYGSRGGEPREVTLESDWRDVGDEPTLLRRRTNGRVFVSPDRVAAAQSAVRSGAQVIVSDDGLQHLRLARDCEIVVVDGARGLGNQRQLPAGPLRERADRLGRVDLVVVNGDPAPKLRAELQEAHGRAPLVMRLKASTVLPVRSAGQEPSAKQAERRSLEEFRGRRVHAVAGIGNPQRFFQQLRADGIEVIEHAFADHHPLTPDQLAFADGLPILMTEKDAVRCVSFADERMAYVPVTAELSASDEQVLMDCVQRALHASSGATR